MYPKSVQFQSPRLRVNIFIYFSMSTDLFYIRKLLFLPELEPSSARIINQREQISYWKSSCPG